jgi:hypothetical protein
LEFALPFYDVPIAWLWFGLDGFQGKIIEPIEINLYLFWQLLDFGHKLDTIHTYLAITGPGLVGVAEGLPSCRPVLFNCLSDWMWQVHRSGASTIFPMVERANSLVTAVGPQTFEHEMQK